mmetsp:Transcript_64352/g.172265  ORF Transcript_64352/g.172265 Transcript_64352/m.172265 type:complete len:300 (+) Transcript_64352:1042-1941(+)
MDLSLLEALLHRITHPINPDRRMQRPDSLRQPRRPAPGLLPAVLRPHVASHENPPAQLAGVRRRVRRVPGDFANILKDLSFGAVRPRLQLRHHPLTHDGDHGGSGGGIRPSGQREKIPTLRRPAQIIPQPERRPVSNLLHGVVDSHLNLRARRQRQRPQVAQRKVHLHPGDGGGGGGLVAPGDEARPESPDVREVHGGDTDLHFIQLAELGPLGHQLPVHPDHTAPIKVQPPTVAALLVGIQVHPPGLLRSPLHQAHPRVQLAQLVVRPGTVGKDLHAVQGHEDVGGVRGEQLLACFRG